MLVDLYGKFAHSWKMGISTAELLLLGSVEWQGRLARTGLLVFRDILAAVDTEVIRKNLGFALLRDETFARALGVALSVPGVFIMDDKIKLVEELDLDAGRLLQDAWTHAETAMINDGFASQHLLAAIKRAGDEPSGYELEALAEEFDRWQDVLDEAHDLATAVGLDRFRSADVL